MASMGVWVFAVIGAVLLLEIVAGRHRNLYSRNDWLVNGLCIVVGSSVRPMLAVIVATAIGLLLPNGRNALADVPFWQALIAIVLLAEFANYWAHRGAHNFERHRYFDWLWRLHRVHHTAKYMNVLLHFRVSLFWTLVSGLTWVVSLAVYLGQGAAAGVAIFIFALWGVVTHSHFRWDDWLRKRPLAGKVLRALEHVIVTPGLHHAHHGYGRDGGLQRNFGVLLSIYDWAFGTLHIPQGRPKFYGIPRPTPHWAEEVFFPLYWKRVPSAAASDGETLKAGS